MNIGDRLQCTVGAFGDIRLTCTVKVVSLNMQHGILVRLRDYENGALLEPGMALELRKAGSLLGRFELFSINRDEGLLTCIEARKADQ